MSNAKRHHYISQGYLAAFTDTGEKNGRFFVYDIIDGNSFQTSPNNVAVQRDFNRISIEGEEPDILENSLASFEDRAINAIRSVIINETFPDKEDYTYIINLICLYAIRNPRMRNTFNRTEEQVMRRVASLIVSDKKTWEHHVKRVSNEGMVPSIDVSYEDMRRFVESGNYRIEISPESCHGREFHAIDTVLQVLGQRQWSLLLAPSDGPELLCSDHPVTLNHKNPKSQNMLGYGIKETEVFIPLSRKLGFYGVFEDPLEPVTTITPTQVAVMNLRVIHNAERHIFSAKRLEE